MIFRQRLGYREISCPGDDLFSKYFNNSSLKDPPTHSPGPPADRPPSPLKEIIFMLIISPFFGKIRYLFK